MKKYEKNTTKRNIKFISIILLITAILCVQVTPVYASSIDFYTASTDEHTRKENKLSGVTKEMCTVDYWENKTIYDWEQELITFDEINTINQSIVDGSGTMTFDLTTLTNSYDADSKQNTLANQSIPTRNLYINGELIDNQTYFGNIENYISTTGFSGTQTPLYAVATNRADIRAWPTNDVIGYSATDTDDEIESSALNLSEAFVIYAKCVNDGETFYWGYSDNCSGWVNSKNLAICKTMDEWKYYWQVDNNNNNFVVVTGSKINFTNSSSNTTSAMLGSILKLVSDDEIPQELKSYTSSNYIVYFASRDKDGFAVKEYAAIDKSLEVNQGFLVFNQKNILTVAFSSLCDEYGWAGMNGNMDCLLYNRQIYKCFGINLPRNTTWQQKIPTNYYDISSMTDEEKEEYISTLPAGSLLYFPGHTMVYIGKDQNKGFVVSDLGGAQDEDASGVQNIYAVNINSLYVKRGSGKTWLSQLNGVINFADKIDLSDCEITLDNNNKTTYEGFSVPSVIVKYNDYYIYDGVNYNVSYLVDKDSNNINISVNGINNFTGNTSYNTSIYKYDFISGGNQCFIEKGIENYSLEIDGDYNKFKSLQIGNLILEKDVDYTVGQGSTIIDFTDDGIEKLNSLPSGSYDVNVMFENNTVKGNLTITSQNNDDDFNDNQSSENSNSNVENPKTGDNIIFAFAGLLISSFGFVIVRKKIRE